MDDTERLDWMARMMAAISGDDPDKAEAAEAVGEIFNKIFNEAIKQEESAQAAFRKAIDGAQVGL